MAKMVPSILKVTHGEKEDKEGNKSTRLPPKGGSRGCYMMLEFLSHQQEVSLLATHIDCLIASENYSFWGVHCDILVLFSKVVTF